MSKSKIKLTPDENQHSGRIQLAISGFKGQNTIDIQDIVTAIDALPNAHLVGLAEIRYDPYRKTQGMLSLLLKKPHINRYQAEFIVRLRTIVIYSIPSEESFFHTLYHEIGHHVFFCIIGSKLKKQWVREIYPRSSFVTEYASRSAAEDFAECYAFYKLNPNALKNIYDKYWFLKEKVFADYQPTNHYREYRI